MSKIKEIRSELTKTYATILSPVTLSIWIACIAVSVLAGPFGTFATMTVPVRFWYWLVVITLAIILGYAVRAVTAVLLAKAHPVWFDAVATISLAVLFAPVVMAIRRYADPLVSDETLYFGSCALNIGVISAGVFVLRRQISLEKPGYLSASNPEAPPVPRLQRRLSEAMQGDILRLSANDHFVEVATTAGVETLRLRLVDAIDEMEPIEGYCTHRSHWVARAAVTGTERENAQKLFLVLCNGDRVPVSRKYRPDLEAAGLIE